MPGKGRPRLTLEDLQARVGAYCARYDVTAAPEGLPPFPAGHRETPRHREWLALYKLQSRLGRRARGLCERCSAPTDEGSVFCKEHRGAASTRAAAGVPTEDRRALLAAQRSKCPICGRRLELAAAVPDAAAATGGARALLHPDCLRLVELARSASPEVLERLRAYLWPKA